MYFSAPYDNSDSLKAANLPLQLPFLNNNNNIHIIIIPSALSAPSFLFKFELLYIRILIASHSRLDMSSMNDFGEFIQPPTIL